MAGRGGGGGPGLDSDEECPRRVRGNGFGSFANLPASGKGGGAANLGGGGPRGGEGSRGGVGSRATASFLDLLAGGGAGGAPRLDDVDEESDAEG